MSTETTVTSLPDCDLCAQDGKIEPAAYDGKTTMGPWAFMCLAHWNQYGVGVGTGRGQKLKEAP